MTQGLILGDSINLVESETLSELWNKRLSHMSERGITCLAKKNLFAGMKQTKVKKMCSLLSRETEKSFFSKSSSFKKV